MKCPFFRTECLKEDCTAYTTEVRVGKDKWVQTVEDGMQYIGQTFTKNPYCNALKVEIPRRKEE